MLDDLPPVVGEHLPVMESLFGSLCHYLTEEEIKLLLDNCVNDYTRDIVTTVINTGMRRQEVLTLKWNQVKKDGFIYLSKTKTDESRHIPINDDLAKLFKGIRKRSQLRFEYIFCDSKDKPFKRP